jgi:hypothetical protein
VARNVPICIGDADSSCYGESQVPVRDEYRSILLNHRALVSMVAVVAVALPCFVQDEEKGALILRIDPVVPRGSIRRANSGIVWTWG